MKTTKYLLIALFFGIMLNGCSYTGGTIGGLLPAPKFTEGKLKDNVYTSKNVYFSVKVPYEKGGHAYRYMQIKEQYHDHGAYISFSSYGSVYRLEVGKKTSLETQAFTLEELMDKTIESYSKQLEQGYKVKPEVINLEEIEINNNPSYIVRLKNNPSYIARLKQELESQTIYNYIIVTEYDKLIVVFMVQATSKDYLEQALEFVKSFKEL